MQVVEYKGKMPLVYVVKVASFDKIAGMIQPLNTICILHNGMFIDVFNYEKYDVFEETKEIISDTKYVVANLGINVISPNSYEKNKKVLEKFGVGGVNFFKKVQRLAKKAIKVVNENPNRYEKIKSRVLKSTNSMLVMG